MLSVKQFTFSPIQENTYVVYNDKGCCIIDPGCYSEIERNQLKDYILSLGFPAKYLLNTHCHLDHVFGNKFIAETFGLVPHIHPKEEQLLAFAPMSGIQWGLPFENYEGELVFIDKNSVIELGDDRLEILETPGHSPGSICFYCRKQGFMISGDVLFEDSIGRTDLPGGNHQVLPESIRRELFTQPDETVIHPGHGRSTTIGQEKQYNPFFN
jgi:glyoxylase-like metal-dependent hydrolase (beta-lactamase superfamily II)